MAGLNQKQLSSFERDGFLVIDDVFDDEIYASVPGLLIRDIGFFIVPANRTWDRMMSFNSELFRRVISSTNGLPAKTIRL